MTISRFIPSSSLCLFFWPFFIHLSHHLLPASFSPRSISRSVSLVAHDVFLRLPFLVTAIIVYMEPVTADAVQNE